MTAPLSGRQLAEFRSADIGEWCEGPWTQDPIEGPEGESGHFLVKDRDGQVVAMVPHWAGSIALFIAVARDAVPALLAEVDQIAVVLAQSEQELTGARLSLWEEEQETRALREERHSTNEALDDAVAAIKAKDERIAEVEAERDQFADRVDTLTAVAKGNVQHVRTLMGDLSAAQSRIAELERRVRAARAERDVEIIQWLVKKAREYEHFRRLPRHECEEVSDVLGQLADKISRGAVRPTPGGVR